VVHTVEGASTAKVVNNVVMPDMMVTTEIAHDKSPFPLIVGVTIQYIGRRLLVAVYASRF
jgi:hypothetical protein